jgi:sec-independent protein translocase protein TatA
MASFNDPVVWILILAVIVFLFGASRIPQFAKSLGQARREFDKGWRGDSTDATHSSAALGDDDPLVQAAKREGIDTTGKTKEQISSELAWKLNKK